MTLAWSGPANGGPATAYRIEAGSAAGAANLAVLDRASTATSFSTPAPRGTYFVRVRALNACGVSVPTEDATVVVP